MHFKDLHFVWVEEWSLFPFKNVLHDETMENSDK